MKVQKQNLHGGSHLSRQAPNFNCLHKAQPMFIFQQIFKPWLLSTPAQERTKVQRSAFAKTHPPPKSTAEHTFIVMSISS